MSEQQHCPGFESNKSLSELTIRCPECGAESEIFSDELEKVMTCKECGKAFSAKENQV